MAAIFARVESGEWKLIAGEVLLFEPSRIPNELRRDSCLAMAEKASRRIRSTLDVMQEADRLASLGIAPLDAAHIASAKAGQSEVPPRDCGKLFFASLRNKLKAKSESPSKEAIPCDTTA